MALCSNEAVGAADIVGGDEGPSFGTSEGILDIDGLKVGCFEGVKPACLEGVRLVSCVSDTVGVNEGLSLSFSNEGIVVDMIFVEVGLTDIVGGDDLDDFMLGLRDIDKLGKEVSCDVALLLD